jgi:hypothetical protein
MAIGSKKVAKGSAASGFRQAAIRAAIVAQALLISDTTAAAHQFQKIVDTSTPIPGGVGAFTAFDEVAYDGLQLAFRARGATAQEGVYLWDGSSLSAVADVTATAPEGAGRFDDFLALSLDDSHVAFVASGTQKDGVYTTLGGALRRVADTSMTMPSSGVPFTQFAFSGDVAISGDNIVFSGLGSDGTASNAGVYRESGGALARVADRTTAIPEFSGSFISFSEVDASGGETLFAGGQGSGGGNGFYTTSGAGAGHVRAVLNDATAIPGLSNPISIFSPNTIRIDGSDMAFSAADSVGGRGIYLERGGVVETIADKNTVDPVTDAAFSAFGTAYSLADGAVAFRGSSTGPTGLYVHQNGMINNVIRAGATLDSKTVASLELYSESLSDGTLAFRAAFVDGTQGIFLATPEQPPQHQVFGPLAPLFDVGSSDGDIIEGQPQISVHTLPEHELRACLEFDLSQLPSAAVIQSAKLTMSVSSIASSEGDASVAVYGYVGNGLLDSSDVQQMSILLGETSTAIELGPFDVALNATLLEALAASSGIVGFVLRATGGEHAVGFDALEAIGGQPLKLTVEYSLAGGDFNGDGGVDSLDLGAWQSNFGSLSADFSQGDADGDSDVDGADFLVWQRGHSASASAAVGNAPEPTTSAAVLVAGAGVAFWRRFPVGFARAQVS